METTLLPQARHRLRGGMGAPGCVQVNPANVSGEGELAQAGPGESSAGVWVVSGKGGI